MWRTVLVDDPPQSVDIPAGPFVVADSVVERSTRAERRGTVFDWSETGQWSPAITAVNVETQRFGRQKTSKGSSMREPKHK